MVVLVEAATIEGVRWPGLVDLEVEGSGGAVRETRVFWAFCDLSEEDDGGGLREVRETDFLRERERRENDEGFWRWLKFVWWRRFEGCWGRWRWTMKGLTVVLWWRRLGFESEGVRGNFEEWVSWELSGESEEEKGFFVWVWWENCERSERVIVEGLSGEWRWRRFFLFRSEREERWWERREGFVSEWIVREWVWVSLRENEREIPERGEWIVLLYFLFFLSFSVESKEREVVVVVEQGS